MCGSGVQSSQVTSFSSTRHTATECQGPIGLYGRRRVKLFTIEELKESLAAAASQGPLDATHVCDAAFIVGRSTRSASALTSRAQYRSSCASRPSAHHRGASLNAWLDLE